MFNDADFKLDVICQIFLQLVLGRFAPFEHEEGGRGDGEAGGDLKHLVNSFLFLRGAKWEIKCGCKWV